MEGVILYVVISVSVSLVFVLLLVYFAEALKHLFEWVFFEGEEEAEQEGESAMSELVSTNLKIEFLLKRREELKAELWKCGALEEVGDLTIDPPSEGEQVAKLQQEILSLQLDNAGLKADRDGWKQRAEDALAAYEQLSTELWLAEARTDPALVVVGQGIATRVGVRYDEDSDPKPPKEGG